MIGYSVFQYLFIPDSACFVYDVSQWDQLMKFGEEIDLEVKLEERIKAQAPNMCCLLIYTVLRPFVFFIYY